LKEVEQLNMLIPVFNEEGYQGLYRKIMEMPQETVNKTLKPLLDRIIPLYNSNRLDKSLEDFWAARAALTFSKGSGIDRGIFSIYLFNLIQLQKGEAIFQAAGIPHAYLEGQNVEIMANSDNVLRGGLTSKHVDVKELMKHVKCEPTIFEILKGAEHPNNEKLYRTPAPDFELSCFNLEPGASSNFISTTSEILLLTEGNIQLSAGTEVLELRPGLPAAIVFPDQQVKLNALQHSLVFRATVPVGAE
ncbi:MAG TPA: mannose-6-phosphate isomerase, class I, partial [Chitinophagaceae bacterium]|nr:mannose-6-phosphate isomerase, class I [Chitinophagaceae bacterium]